MPAPSSLLKQDLERISHVSSARENFMSMKTPAHLEDGALREGGAPDLYSRQYIGLLGQYAAVGLIYGVLPHVIYPFLQNYLNMNGTMTTTAQVLVDLPWSFKVYYGMASDMFPLFGYRRRPYMLLGWTICVAMLLIMGCTPITGPYFPTEEIRHTKPEDYTADQLAALNTKAPDSGSKYVILMMLSAFGYLMADVCADGVVVELAQREPEEIRGRTQTTIYMVRSIFSILANALIAFAFNGEDYGGDFHFSLPFNTFMLILAICIAPVLPVTWLFIHEEKSAKINRREYLWHMWEFIQQRAIYQIIAYKFIAGVFENWGFVALNPVQSFWAHVTPLNEKLSSMFGLLVFSISLKITGKYGLHWNWRYMAIVTMLSVIALDAVCTMLTVWNVVRSQWFWLGLPIVQNLPAGIQFIVSTYVTVELADEGNEGAVYGLITTVSNLAAPFAAMLTKYSNRMFTLDSETIQNDSHQVRKDVTITIWIMYAMKAFSLVWLFLLPRQKAETAELKRNGGSSKLLGAFTIFYLMTALVYSVSTNVMGIFPSTACLVIAGGDGC